MSNSQAIEDYAKTIYAISRERDGLVLNGEVAERLGVTPATATSMLKKLAGLGLVNYLPYKGVSLTPAGEKVALEVIRHHRLIEAYLSEALGMPEDRVHEEAEVLEHYISEELEAADRRQARRTAPRPARDADPRPRPGAAQLGGAVKRTVSGAGAGRGGRAPPGGGRGRPPRRGRGRPRRPPLARRAQPRRPPLLAFPRPRLRRRGRLHRPRQLRHQHLRRRQVRLPAALGRARGQPDRDAGPDPVGEAGDRDREEPRRALPRALLAPRLDRPLAAGRGGGDGLRHRRGGRRRPRSQPPLRDPALPGRADRRRRRLRDPRPAADAASAGSRRGSPSSSASSSPPSPSSSSTPAPTAGEVAKHLVRARASPAPRACCSPPGSSARR